MNDTSDQTDNSDERTEELTRTESTQQLPVHDQDAPTDTREPVATTVFGATAPQDPASEAGAPSSQTTEASTTAPSTTPAAPWPPPVPPRPTGPHAPAIILGLIALAVAGIVLAQELGNLSIDWGDVGPLGFVAVGAVLVVLGAVGLVTSNRRSGSS